MAVPLDADAPPPTAPPIALPILPTIPTIACLGRISVIMDGTERGEAAPVLFTAGQHRRHILRVPSKVCGSTFNLRHILSVALSSHSLQPDFRPAIQFPRSRSSAAQSFCSDMTLFSARGLSPYCSFRRCSVASCSACRLSAPVSCINSGPFCPLLLCEFIRLLRQRVQALLIRNLVAKCSQLAFCTQRLILCASRISPVQTAGDVAPPPQYRRLTSAFHKSRRCWLISHLLRHASPASSSAEASAGQHEHCLPDDRPQTPSRRTVSAFQRRFIILSPPPSACCNLPVGFSRLFSALFSSSLMGGIFLQRCLQPFVSLCASSVYFSRDARYRSAAAHFVLLTLLFSLLSGRLQAQDGPFHDHPVTRPRFIVNKIIILADSRCRPLSNAASALISIS